MAGINHQRERGASRLGTHEAVRQARIRIGRAAYRDNDEAIVSHCRLCSGGPVPKVDNKSSPACKEAVVCPGEPHRPADSRGKKSALCQTLSASRVWVADKAWWTEDLAELNGLEAYMKMPCLSSMLQEGLERQCLKAHQHKPSARSTATQYFDKLCMGRKHLAVFAGKRRAQHGRVEFVCQGQLAVDGQECFGSNWAACPKWSAMTPHRLSVPTCITVESESARTVGTTATC